LLAIFVFGVMIFVHELGHYISARACGVGIKEFAIGMGPKIYSRVSNKTGIRYSIRLFPVGGFVSMVGEDEESEADDAFGKKSVWRRMIIIIAGAFMNLALGFLIMLVIVSTTKGYLAVNVVAEFDDGAMSEASGLMVDDRIIKINNTRIHTGYDLSYEIMNQGDVAVDLTVIRNGEKIVLKDVIFPTFSESGATFGQSDFTPYGEQKTLFTVIKHTWFRSVSTVKMVADSLIDLIRGRYGIDAVSGPVGITEQIGNAAKTSSVNLLYICAVISINLGIINLLPLPALDGGRFVFLLVEAIRRKPVNKNIEGYVHFIGIVVLFALMILITMKDIWGLVN
jgi:regulator of sigma E protease